MTLWAITIDTALLEPVTDDQVAGLVDIMTARDAAVSVGDERISCTITVAADDWTKAAALASKTWRLELKEQRISAGVDVAVEVMTVDEQDRRLAVSPVPELWGAVEVAQELGVSRQRVHQLVAEHSRFPAPLMRLGGGPLWLADTIRAFNASWSRRPGRPPAAIRCATCGEVLHGASRDQLQEGVEEHDAQHDGPTVFELASNVETLQSLS